MALCSKMSPVSQPLGQYEERSLCANLLQILKGCQPRLRCFHHRGANLAAQEEGVSALSFEHKGLFVSLCRAQLEGALLSRVCTPISLSCIQTHNTFEGKQCNGENANFRVYNFPAFAKEAMK